MDRRDLRFPLEPFSLDPRDPYHHGENRARGILSDAPKLQILHLEVMPLLTIPARVHEFAWTRSRGIKQRPEQSILQFQVPAN